MIETRETLTMLPVSLPHLIFNGYNSIPISLIGEDSRERLMSFASLWAPDFKASCLNFECSLQNGDTWADIGTIFYVSSGSFFKSLQLIPFRDLHWDRMVRLLGKWSRSGYLAEQGISTVRLAYDVGSCPDRPPEPKIFFTFNKANPDLLGFLVTAVVPLLGLSPQPLLPVFQKFVLGNPSRLLGFSLSDPGYVRASILTKHSNLRSHMSFFSQMQLSGILDSFEELVRENRYLMMHPFGLEINIDSEGMICPSIGVTIRIDPHSSNEIGSFLESLVKKGLVSPEKKQDLFPLTKTEVKPFLDLPCDYHYVTSTFFRKLKLVFASNGKTSVKAYFGVKCSLFHECDYEEAMRVMT